MPQNLDGTVTCGSTSKDVDLAWVLFLRYFEMQAQIGKVIGVLKKRTSGFENTLREFEITSYGLKVGSPMHHLRGMLSGIPEIDRSTQ